MNRGLDHYAGADPDHTILASECEWEPEFQLESQSQAEKQFVSDKEQPVHSGKASDKLVFDMKRPVRERALEWALQLVRSRVFGLDDI